MNLKKIKLPVVVLILLTLLAYAPAVLAAAQIPAKPDRFDYVFDYANILSPQDRAKISALGRELDEKTKAQVVVVTVDSIGNSAMDQYANALFRAWGLGDREKNNGVLLLVNKENMLTGKPGRVRIEVGYGLEGAIPDGKAGRILDSYVLPRWDAQKYSEGVLQGYLAIVAETAKEYNITLQGGYAPVPIEQSGSSEGFPAPVMGLIIAVIILAFFAAFAGKNRRGGRGFFGGGGFWGGGGFGGGGFGGGGFGGGFGGGSSGGGGAGR